MADLNLEWGGDLSFTPSGDLQLADANLLTRQRIERRLFTAVRGYLWHLEYGAGLPEKIGHSGTPTVIQALVSANIALEASVAAFPKPQITVFQSTASIGMFVITIIYYDAALGQQLTLSFDTSGQSVSPVLLEG